MDDDLPRCTRDTCHVTREEKMLLITTQLQKKDASNETKTDAIQHAIITLPRCLPRDEKKRYG
jgi:hypothetical protein